MKKPRINLDWEIVTIKENPYLPKGFALLVSKRPPWEGGDDIVILDFRKKKTVGEKITKGAGE